MRHFQFLTACFAGMLLIGCNREEAWVVQDMTTDDSRELQLFMDAEDFFQPDIFNPFDGYYDVTIKPYLTALGLQPVKIHDQKALLGRVLFYDSKLSKDNSISCASCHKQAFAFGDNVAFSAGVSGQKSLRNTIALGHTAQFGAHYRSVNNGSAPSLLWDQRASTVATQAPLAFTNPHEMGMTMNEVVEKARQQAYYPYFFQAAYGDTDITEERITECLQEFVHAIGASNSKLDRALDKVNGDLFGTFDTLVFDTIRTIYYGGSFGSGGSFTLVPAGTAASQLLHFNASELRGRTIFAENCTKCHSSVRPFQEFFMACNGLDMNYADQGVGGITGRPEDMGVFKAPSLRNIALTAPYMHDGRFRTLGEVVDFYSSGVNDHPNLHPFMRKADGSFHLNLTDQEKADLIAFLHTLTDSYVTIHPFFSNPFKY